jgi:hypothetical protein
MAESAIRHLLEEIAEGAAPAGKWEIHKPELIVRASTRGADDPARD